jgi:ABC-type transport system involved in multi-copper enzyme maturation permease subunit
MSAKSMRILKDARSLFGPWCLVVMAGLLPLVGRSFSGLMGSSRLWGTYNWIEPVSFLGYFLGIPLLATLPMGTEFQHRTLPLLLSQPVGRTQIWFEKLSVTLVASLSAALAFYFSWRSELQKEHGLWMIAGASMIAAIASAPFWTLIARSTMGGMALNGVNSFISLTWHTRPDLIPGTMMARWVTGLAFLCYIGVMLWMGRRTLARFQMTGGMAGEDLLMAGPDLMPAALGAWFRSRPTGAALNLIRKELRLLRPVWLLSALAIPVWICLPVMGATVQGKSISLALMVVAFTPLMAVLSGSLSLGEERSSGTHAWHLTQPVAARRQWLIKLVVGLLTSMICAMAFPVLGVIAGRSIFGSSLLTVNLETTWKWTLIVLLLSFASFWCASVISGTVRAVLLVFPVIVAVALAGSLGAWLGPKVTIFLTTSLNFFSSFRFTNALANVDIYDIGEALFLLLALLLLPTLAIAATQSCRLFRIQLQDSVILVVRRVLPLALSAALCSFLLEAAFSFGLAAKDQLWRSFRETHEAIEKVETDAANLHGTTPFQLTAEDLVKAAPLSERTQRWLNGARITVTPVASHFGGREGKYCCGGNSRGFQIDSGKVHSWYEATVDLPSGSRCTISFIAGRGFGMLGGVCK